MQHFTPPVTRLANLRIFHPSFITRVEVSLRRSWPQFLLFFLLAPPNAQADILLHPWEDHHQAYRIGEIGADFLYYSSHNNYDPNGASYTPSGLSQYARANFDFSGTYGFTRQWSGFARISWEMAKVNTTNTTAFGGTTWGFGDQLLGINYRVNEKESGSSFDLQAQAEVPVYSGNTSALPLTSPVLGNASLNLSLGGILNIPLGWRSDNVTDWMLTGGAGFTYRTAGFSSSLPWSVKAGFKPRQDGFLANLMGFGDFSLKTDSNDTNSLLVYNSLLTSFNSGGSYVTGAINPSLLTLRGQIGYVLPNDDTVTLSLAQAVWGRSAPNGFTFAVGLSTHLGKGAISEPAFQSAAQYSKSNKGYVDYNLDAKVVRANDHFNLIKIDKGASDGVVVGDVFDIFMLKPNGTAGAAIARGQVTNTKPNESAIKIQEYFKEIWIDEGFIARRALN